MSDEWETPQDLFDELDAEFGFTLDACATPENAKCEKFFSIAEDGLAQDWAGEIVFVNPPWSRGMVGRWVRKAFMESGRGATVILLIPAWTDRSYFHDHCLRGEIRFIRGRLNFRRCSDGFVGRCPVPVMLVIFRAGR